MFTIDTILDSVSSSTASVDIYPDTTAALEITALHEQVKLLESSGIEPELAITEKHPREELIEKIEELRNKRVTFTMRVMSSAELDVIKRKALAKFKIPKDISQEERLQYEMERDEVLYTYLIAQATTRVEDASTGEFLTSIKQSDVMKLYKMLPAAEWKQLCSCWDSAQGLGFTMAKALSDPSFRRDEAVTA